MFIVDESSLHVKLSFLMFNKISNHAAEGRKCLNLKEVGLRTQPIIAICCGKVAHSAPHIVIIILTGQMIIM